MHKKKFIVSSFYKFVYLRNPDVIKKKLFINLKKFNIKGTFIIGKEGINASFSVSTEQFEKVKSSIQNLISVEIKFRIEFLTSSNCSVDIENEALIPSFPRMKVPLMLNFFKLINSLFLITSGFLR